ncbi:hypothetical protein [Catenulispora rubra]|uniref:hypothetical protein n=1 Tax=Catenulispora rubra TaxID=280293 RepID=UPI0018925746|nr:hypothetical protein [Catenulispora rubra]
MTQSGRVDYDQVARAQALLLDRRRLSPAALVTAYRTVRTATPDAYTEMFVDALLSHGHDLHGEQQIAAWQEAVEVARSAAEADPRELKVLVEALTKYQHGLCDAGRRAEGLEACREMALASKRAFDSGVVSSPTFGSSQLACRLAEDGDHAEAAALFEAIVRENEREKSATDFWSRIPWIAEMEAAGHHASARSTLQELVNEDRQQADQHIGAYAFVIWEQLLLAWMDRQNGREDEAERCDAETEAVLTMLAADGEPKNWSNILGFWALLIRLTGRTKRGQLAHDEAGAPLFSDLHWAPTGHRAYLNEGHDRLQAEVARIAGLAEREPSAHLGELVEVQRQLTLRSVRIWELRTWRIPDELRRCFDEGVNLARRLVEVDEPLGRAALARALADRTSMHVAARDFPPALRDFQRARRAAAGDPLA